MTNAKPTLRAIAYAPDPSDIEATARCIDHARRLGYKLTGVVPRDFAAALGMLADGRAAVLIVDRRTDIPVDLIPRIEVVAECVPHGRPEHRRPGRINRRAGAA